MVGERKVVAERLVSLGPTKAFVEEEPMVAGCGHTWGPLSCFSNNTPWKL